VLEPRYQPNLLGFLGIDVFACGLRDHEVRINIQRWFGVATQVDPLLLEKKMASFFTNTFKMPYFEFLIGSATQHFTNLMIVAERNEQAIKIGKIKGPIVNSKVIIKHELGNDSQIRKPVRLDLTISSGAHTLLSKINIPLPLKNIYQHFLNTRHITLAPPDPIKPLFSRWYNPNEK
jgi:hypothetical protein